jgi:hypothetical protein
MCLYVALGLITPRLVLALLFLFRSAWVAILQPWWLAVLGFLFVPFTSLAYVLIHAQTGHVDGTAHWLILLIALFMDAGVWGGSRRKRAQD